MRKEIEVRFGRRKRVGSDRKRTQLHCLMDAAMAQAVEPTQVEKKLDFTCTGGGDTEVVVVGERKKAVERLAGKEQRQISETSPAGKKLSRRERRKKEKMALAAAQQAEASALAVQGSLEGAQFACSQTPVEDSQQWKNSLNVSVPSFSISAAGKTLFDDAALSLTQGRRYGLVAPNGHGKSTLLKMIATGKLNIPPRIDHLYVEQEVLADR
ncbi:sub-family F member [Seminavis robusta]|uniref:Sub-family F member n=1 Tax=Seminavis robusta TaxID=568900 RepID=A0A9N8EMN9_9STRA|nr:sub-family F member [Seminavis robusta]|eukprot:Sro1378_g267620.1 sub-family F member (212) ;mRNA; r:9569-10204